MEYTMFTFMGSTMDCMTKFMKCGKCRFMFSAHRHDEIWDCPYCKTLNIGNGDVREYLESRGLYGKRKTKS